EPARGRPPLRLRLPAAAGPEHRQVRQLRGRRQLHLDPHRDVPALLLRLRRGRPGLPLVVAAGVRRPAHGGPVLRRAGRALPRRRIALQLDQAPGQRDHLLDGRVDDAHGLRRDAVGHRARLPDHAAPAVVGLPDRGRRHGHLRLRGQRGHPGQRADRLHHAGQRLRRPADVADQQRRGPRRAG
ncbi:MAG: Urea carboxylase-related amino acid permease, partial [uncultured Pseudonocardia sp.]